MSGASSSSPRASASAPPEDDRVLIERALRGDHLAFHHLHRCHVDFVWSRLTRLLGPDPEREDLTQQIFVDVFRGLAGFRGESSFRTYLHRVVARTAFDQLSRRRRMPPRIGADSLASISTPEASPELRAEQRQRLAQAWALLDRIKPKKRIAFILRVIEGRSLEETGELVGASVPTVAKRVKHAQDELNALWRRRGTERLPAELSARDQKGMP